MTILVLYQDVQSGAKVATESIITAYTRLFPKDRLIIYKQPLGYHTGPFSFLLNLLWSMWDFVRLLKKTTNIDVIVSTQYTFVLPWNMVFAGRVPAIFHVHGDQRFPKAPVGRFIVGYWYHLFVNTLVSYLQQHAITTATGVAFVSPRVRDIFLHDLRIKKGRINAFILPNGVDRNIFKPLSALQKKAFRKKYRARPSLHIGYIGRIDIKKGVHHLIDSLNFINVPTTLWVGYPTPTDQYSRRYERRLQHIAKKVHPRHLVRFIENPKPITDIYNIIDYLLLPSEQEMLPLVLLESLSCGVLPLAADTGGIKELLSGVSSLLLLPSISPRAIADKLQIISCMSQHRRNELIHRGKTLADMHPWSNCAIRLRREMTTILHR